MTLTVACLATDAAAFSWSTVEKTYRRENESSVSIYTLSDTDTLSRHEGLVWVDCEGSTYYGVELIHDVANNNRALGDSLDAARKTHGTLTPEIVQAEVEVLGALNMFEQGKYEMNADALVEICSSMNGGVVPEELLHQEWRLQW